MKHYFLEMENSKYLVYGKGNKREIVCDLGEHVNHLSAINMVKNDIGDIWYQKLKCCVVSCDKNIEKLPTLQDFSKTYKTPISNKLLKLLKKLKKI